MLLVLSDSFTRAEKNKIKKGYRSLKEDRELCFRQRLNDADYQTKQKALKNSTLKITIVGILITLLVVSVSLLWVARLWSEITSLITSL
jgi:uncharacterized protein (DUF983 family)